MSTKLIIQKYSLAHAVSKEKPHMFMVYIILIAYFFFIKAVYYDNVGWLEREKYKSLRKTLRASWSLCYKDDHKLIWYTLEKEKSDYMRVFVKVTSEWEHNSCYVSRL